MIARRRSGSRAQIVERLVERGGEHFGSSHVRLGRVPAQEQCGDDRAGHEEQPEDDDELAPAEVEGARRGGAAVVPLGSHGLAAGRSGG